MLRGRKYTERHFADTAQIGTATAHTGGPSPSAITWTYDTVNTVQCHIDDHTRGSLEEVNDGSGVTLSDAVVYMPVGTSVASTQRIKITHRYHAVLGTAEIWAVIGTPQQAHNCLAVRVKRVTGNSLK